MKVDKEQWPSALVHLMFFMLRYRGLLSMNSEEDESSTPWISAGAFLGGCEFKR